MSKTRILFVSHEMSPYVNLTEIGKIMKSLPQKVQEKGVEIRVLMPRFGIINERKHRLHEVVRLSGMNIIVDDDDFPLIMKVASFPGARMQVYFLDNDEFFRRKFVFHDKNENPYKDNQDRMVFFCKGTMEIVKKFGWAPDIIHVHGWMSSLVPFYAKTVYKDDPIFENSKVIYSVYDETLEDSFDKNFLEKASINDLDAEDLVDFTDGDKIKLHQGAIIHSDALIRGSATYSEDLEKQIKEFDKPVLDCQDEIFVPTYMEFYKSLLTE